MCLEEAIMTGTTKYIAIFNLKWNKIRINQPTILSMGYPKRVLLLIHPEKKEFVIQPCNRFETLSFRIPSDFDKDTHGFELSSIQLTELLSKEMGWDMNKSYRVMGYYVEKENIVVFPLTDFSIV